MSGALTLGGLLMLSACAPQSSTTGDAAAAARDPIWRLPLYEEYEKLIESKIANVKNTAGRAGGAIGAAVTGARRAEVG